MLRRAALRLTLGAVALVAALAGAAVAAPGPAVRFTAPATGAAAGGGDLWVSIAGNGALVRLDARTGRVLARIDVHRADRRALGGGALATAGSEVWVAAPVHVDDDPAVGDASGWIGRVDVRHARLRITQVHGDPPTQIAVGPAGIWISGGRTVRRVDPRTGAPGAALSLPVYAGAVAVGASAVWVQEPNAGRLVEIDPRTRKVRGTVTIGRSAGRGSLAVVGGAVWAATNRGLVRVGQRSRRVTARVSAPGATALAAGPTGLWAVGRSGVYVVRGTQIAKRSAMRGDLIAVAGGSVWVGDAASNSLRRVGPS
jgi:streptogramin lyase